MHAVELPQALAELLEARAAAGRGRTDPPRAQDDGERPAGQERGQNEAPAEARVPDHRLAEERGQRGGSEAGEAEDAERPAPAVHRHQIHDVDVVRHEEGGEGEPLQGAQHRMERDGMAQHEAHRREREQQRAQAHEEAAAQAIHPQSHQGLEEDSGQAVRALDEPHVRLVAAHLLHVDGQEEEEVHAHEEEEVHEHGLEERPAHEQRDGRGHVRCGGAGRNSRMTAAMRRAKYSTRAHA